MPRFAALLTFVLNLLGAWKRRQEAAKAVAERQEGVATEHAAIQEQVLHEVEQAKKAREAVDHQLAAEPGSLRDDDGFRRPD